MSNEQQLPRIPQRSLSVVIPVHNEGSTISALLDTVYEKGLCGQDDFEVILVEDGSTDNTREVLKACRERLPNLILELAPEKLGYGRAAAKGLLRAQKDWILLMDGDGQIEAEDMGLLLACSPDFDLVLAEKFPRCDPVFRILLSRLFDLCTDLLLGICIKDINFGFRLMRREAAQALAPRCGQLGDIFNAEMAIRYIYGGARVQQVRVRHRKRRIGVSQGIPPGKVVSTAWRAFRGLFRLRRELITDH